MIKEGPPKPGLHDFPDRFIAVLFYVAKKLKMAYPIHMTADKLNVVYLQTELIKNINMY